MWSVLGKFVSKNLKNWNFQQFIYLTKNKICIVSYRGYLYLAEFQKDFWYVHQLKEAYFPPKVSTNQKELNNKQNVEGKISRTLIDPHVNYCIYWIPQPTIQNIYTNQGVASTRTYWRRSLISFFNLNPRPCPIFQIQGLHQKMNVVFLNNYVCVLERGMGLVFCKHFLDKRTIKRYQGGATQWYNSKIREAAKAKVWIYIKTLEKRKWLGYSPCNQNKRVCTK